MRLLPALLLAACARRPPADAGAAPPPPPAPAEPAEPEQAPPGWLKDVIPALEARDFARAEEVLTGTLEDPALSPQERTLALWYRAAARAQQGDRAGEIEDLRAFVSASRLVHIAGDAPGAVLQHRVSLAQLAVAADDASQDPSVGATRESAISVLIAPDEYFFVGRLSCGPDRSSPYSVLDQQLLHEDTGVYDVLLTRCEADGAERTFYFDIYTWWQLLSFSLGAGPPPDGFDAEGAKALMELAMPR